jgi:adenylate cyclase
VTPSKPPDVQNDEYWHDYLTKGSPMEIAARRFLVRVPRGPRCYMCAAPFSGIGAPVMRLIGKRQSDKNPHMCQACFTFLARHHGGAEIELTLLFADIRGSTTLAEGMSSAEFRALLDRFYTVAARAIFDHDGGVDKFVGDEVIAFFFPLIAGEQHAARGVEAAQALLRATGHPAGSLGARGRRRPHRDELDGRGRGGLADPAHRCRRCGEHHRAAGIAGGCRRDPGQR